MIEYSKIETLYNRDEKTGKIIIEKVRCPEFLNIKSWQVTEKIDGTNIRICLLQDGSVKIGGRTDAAQIYAPLAEYLYGTFTGEKLKAVFYRENEPSFEVMLFGEGYGAKINSGGGYRAGVSFRLFDVRIGEWWLKWQDMIDIAAKLGIETVPSIPPLLTHLPTSSEELKEIISFSQVLEDGGSPRIAEGIVVREPNGLLMRNRQRLMWKLKFKDFGEWR